MKLIKELEVFYYRMRWDVPFKMSGTPGLFGMPSEILKKSHKTQTSTSAASNLKLLKNLHCFWKIVVTLFHFNFWN